MSGGVTTFYDFLTAIGVTPDSLLLAIEGASSDFASAAVAAAPIVLTATMAIKVIIDVIKELIDGDLVDVISSVIYAIILGLVLSTVLALWQSGGSGCDGSVTVRSLASCAQDGVMSLASDEPVDTLVGSAFRSGAGAIMTMFNMLTVVSNNVFQPVREANLLDVLDALAIAATQILLLGFAALIFTLACIAIMILLCFVVFHALAGLATVQIALAFGPLTLMAYPLIDQWFKKAISAIAGGIAQATAGLLLLMVVMELIERLSETLTEIIPIPPSQGQEEPALPPEQIVLRLVSLIMGFGGLIVACILLSLLSGKFMSAASDIFSGIGSGMTAGAGAKMAQAAAAAVSGGAAGAAAGSAAMGATMVGRGAGAIGGALVGGVGGVVKSLAGINSSPKGSGGGPKDP